MNTSDGLGTVNGDDRVEMDGFERMDDPETEGRDNFDRMEDSDTLGVERMLNDGGEREGYLIPEGTDGVRALDRRGICVDTGRLNADAEGTEIDGVIPWLYLPTFSVLIFMLGVGVTG